ncbi:hypothetical protein JCM16303_004249 [Sporobolomyces ruberrimus]
MPRTSPEERFEALQGALTTYQTAYKAWIATGQDKPVVSAIARRFDVANATLTRGFVSSINAAKKTSRLNDAEQQTVIEWIVWKAKTGFPSTIRQLRACVKDLLEKKGDTRPLGRNWHRRFVRSHRIDLKVKRALPLEIGRAKCLTPPIVARHFENLRELFKICEIDPTNEDDWGRVVNMDETGHQFTPQREKHVLPSQGYTGEAVRASGRENVTALMAICGNGSYLRPLVIFKGKRVQSNWQGQNPSLAHVACQENGWIDNNLFFAYCKDHAFPELRARINDDSKAGAVVLDGHKSHVTNKIRELGLSMNVHILCLPPHTTDRIQPLDVAVNSPHKHYWSQEIHKETAVFGTSVVCPWFTLIHAKELLDRPGTTGNAKKKHWLELFGRAFRKSHNPENIAAGFRKAGILPFDPSVIPAVDVERGDALDGVQNAANGVPLSQTGSQLQLLAQSSSEDDALVVGLNELRCDQDTTTQGDFDDEMDEETDVEESDEESDEEDARVASVGNANELPRSLATSASSDRELQRTTSLSTLAAAQLNVLDAPPLPLVARNLLGRIPLYPSSDHHLPRQHALDLLKQTRDVALSLADQLEATAASKALLAHQNAIQADVISQRQDRQAQQEEEEESHAVDIGDSGGFILTHERRGEMIEERRLAVEEETQRKEAKKQEKAAKKAEREQSQAEKKAETARKAEERKKKKAEKMAETARKAAEKQQGKRNSALRQKTKTSRQPAKKVSFAPETQVAPDNQYTGSVLPENGYFYDEDANSFPSMDFETGSEARFELPPPPPTDSWDLPTTHYSAPSDHFQSRTTGSYNPYKASYLPEQGYPLANAHPSGSRQPFDLLATANQPRTYASLGNMNLDPIMNGLGATENVNPSIYGLHPQ